MKLKLCQHIIILEYLHYKNAIKWNLKNAWLLFLSPSRIESEQAVTKTLKISNSLDWNQQQSNNTMQGLLLAK